MNVVIITTINRIPKKDGCGDCEWVVESLNRNPFKSLLLVRLSKWNQRIFVVKSE